MIGMSEDFGDDGDAYVKGENDVPIDWDAISRLDGLFQKLLDLDDDESRLTRAKALVDEMYGD
jgi:hypothetical protein